VKIFKKQTRLLKLLLLLAKPNKAQRKDIDFLLTLGEIFTLVVYGQLILENAKIYNIGDDIVNQIFDFMVRDFSKFALQMYSKTSSTGRQMRLCSMMVKKPAVNKDLFDRVWKNYVYALKDQYVMSE
jgi:acyl-CoA dehydrogenase